MCKLKILHMSDIHFGSDTSSGLQTKISENAKQAAHQHCLEQNTKPDYVFFSGDLAYSGKTEQFEIGKEWLKSLMEPWPNAKLFIVPGNHDVDRQQNGTELPVTTFLKGASLKEASFYNNVEAIENSPHLNNFYNWIQQNSVELRIVSPWNSNKRLSYHSEKIDGLQVHIIGLNSALLSCEDNEQGTIVADSSGLDSLLGETAIDCTKDLVILISHHPIGFSDHEFSDATTEKWFAEWNDAALSKSLLSSTGAHVYFHGHLHASKGTSLNFSSGQHLAYFGAGALYQKNTGGHNEYPNRFSYFTIDLPDQLILPATFEYSSAGQWEFTEQLSKPIKTVLPIDPEKNVKELEKKLNECKTEIHNKNDDLQDLHLFNRNVMRAFSQDFVPNNSIVKHHIQSVEWYCRVQTNGDCAFEIIYEISGNSVSRAIGFYVN